MTPLTHHCCFLFPALSACRPSGALPRKKASCARILLQAACNAQSTCPTTAEPTLKPKKAAPLSIAQTVAHTCQHAARSMKQANSPQSSPTFSSHAHLLYKQSISSKLVQQLQSPAISIGRWRHPAIPQIEIRRSLNTARNLVRQPVSASQACQGIPCIVGTERNTVYRRNGTCGIRKRTMHL